MPKSFSVGIPEWTQRHPGDRRAQKIKIKSLWGSRVAWHQPHCGMFGISKKEHQGALERKPAVPGRDAWERRWSLLKSQVHVPRSVKIGMWR
jgi:hypothetical protein